MSDHEQPRLYLITPSSFDFSLFPKILSDILDVSDVACLRLSTAGMDEPTVRQAADTLRPISHDRDIPLVIENHAKLVGPLGLDGVHLSDGARQIRALRKELGPDPILGAQCGDSRHDGMIAAEAGADYISFGPVGVTPLGDGSQAQPDLFAWWSEMIEVPVVAEGYLDEISISNLCKITDFIAIGSEIWGDPDPKQKLQSLIKALAES